MTYRSTGSGIVQQPSVVRLGSTGGIIEARLLFISRANNGTFPSVAYDADLGRFPIVFATDQTNDPVYGRALEYPADAINTRYGTGCGLGVIYAADPYAGKRNFRVQVQSAPATTPGFLFCALGPSSLPLASINMPGCFFNTDPTTFVLNLNGTTSSVGLLLFPIPLPDVPAVTGDLYFQIFYVSINANPAHLQATRGMHCQIR